MNHGFVFTALFLLQPVGSVFGSSSNQILLWKDDFDIEGIPNDLYWNFDVGPPGWGNGEFQEYTNHADNAHIHDGALHITAIRDAESELGFTSARLTTAGKVSLQYGTIEARIRIPNIQLGLWPAFWTMGNSFNDGVPWPACGEIDIMEIGQQRGVVIDGVANRRIITAAHYEKHDQNDIQKGIFDAPMDLSQNFHIYRLEWTPNYLKTYVDNMEMWRMKIAPGVCEDCEEFHQPHFMILNLAIGGGFTCCKYGSEVPDQPIGTKWAMSVDYVRVYANEHTQFYGRTSSPPTSIEQPLDSSIYITTSPSPLSSPSSSSLSGMGSISSQGNVGPQSLVDASAWRGTSSGHIMKWKFPIAMSLIGSCSVLLM